MIEPSARPKQEPTSRSDIDLVLDRVIVWNRVIQASTLSIFLVLSALIYIAVKLNQSESTLRDYTIQSEMVIKKLHEVDKKLVVLETMFQNLQADTRGLEATITRQDVLTESDRKSLSNAIETLNKQGLLIQALEKEIASIKRESEKQP